MEARWIVSEPYALKGKKSAVNTFDSVVEVGNMLIFCVLDRKAGWLWHLCFDTLNYLAGMHIKNKTRKKPQTTTKPPQTLIVSTASI